jgi:hypothetical protein
VLTKRKTGIAPPVFQKIFATSKAFGAKLLRTFYFSIILRGLFINNE